jgi:hypothetical protein
VNVKFLINYKLNINIDKKLYILIYMRILSKIKKNYGDIKDILKNDLSNILDNIKSITFNGSNLYILSNDLLFYNFETNNLNVLSGNVILKNPSKIEYSHDKIYVLDNNNIYNYNTLNDSYSLLISGPIDVKLTSVYNFVSLTPISTVTLPPYNSFNTILNN